MTTQDNPFDNETYEQYDDIVTSAVNRAMSELMNKGYIEVVGMNEDGEWLYQVTDVVREIGVDEVMRQMNASTDDNGLNNHP